MQFKQVVFWIKWSKRLNSVMAEPYFIDLGQLDNPFFHRKITFKRFIL